MGSEIKSGVASQAAELNIESHTALHYIYGAHRTPLQSKRFHTFPRLTGIGFPDSSTATNVKTPCVTRSSSPVI